MKNFKPIPLRSPKVHLWRSQPKNNDKLTLVGGSNNYGLFVNEPVHTYRSPVSQRSALLQAVGTQETSSAPIQAKEAETANQTGLPDRLKTGIEHLSGYSMDDVKVHYNSSKPAGLNAHAYAQGTDIHLAPGQEKHLAHEAWHVVQQKQGRVKPTMQMKGNLNVNDDKSLEREADVMGAKALPMKLTRKECQPTSNFNHGENGKNIQRMGLKKQPTTNPNSGMQKSNSGSQNIIQMFGRKADGTAVIPMGYWGYRTMAIGNTIETHNMTSCVAVAAYTDDSAHAIVAHFGALVSGQTISEAATRNYRRRRA